MKDRVLKNNDDFLRWKKDCTASCDIVSQPKQFPCLAKMFVSDWAYQEETAEYLYVEDLEEILSEMRSA